MNNGFTGQRRDIASYGLIGFFGFRSLMVLEVFDSAITFRRNVVAGQPTQHRRVD
jgi:hypothetical protein